jgi:hypothetical protein
MLYNIQIYYLHTDTYKEFAMNCEIEELYCDGILFFNIKISHETYIIQKGKMLELFDLQEYVNDICIMRNFILENSDYHIFTESFNVWFNPINDQV